MALGGRLWKALRGGGRRTPWINGTLAVLLVVAVVMAFTIIGNPSAPPAPVRTAVVTRGDVTATVTGSGNAASQTSVPASFPTDGTVTAVNVKSGDTVTLGEVLATVDARPSQESLQTAQASLDGARAAYEQAAAGPTDVKRQQDQQAITEAQQGVDNARTQLANDTNSTDTDVKTARVTLTTDTAAQDTAVSQARTNASTACSGVQLEAFEAPLTTAPSSGGSTSTATGAPTTTRTSTPTTTTRTSTPTTTAPTTRTSTPAPTTTSSTGTGTTGAPTSTGSSATSTTSADAGSCTQAQQSLKNAENSRDQTVQKDRLAITSAEQGQDATLDKDRQAIVTAQGQVRDAQLAAQADLKPETPAQIEQARSNVDSAQVAVDTARRNLDGTVLRAPIDGVVLAVNGKVGESSGSTSSATSATSSTGTSGSTSSAASSSTTSAGSGFVVIANPSQLEVTANVAEADAAGLQLGQQATVTFPATNDTATGTVTQITPQSTVTNNVVLYPVVVSLDTAPAGVKTGSTASLSITKQQADGVLEVPTAAITTSGANHTVTVLRNGTQTVVPVTVGLTGVTTTQITGGLQEGDSVVLPTPSTATTPATGGGFPRLGGR
jgi:HlyD family secretion protein